MRDCPRKWGNYDSGQITIAFNEDSYESDGTLVVLSLESKEVWIMD